MQGSATSEQLSAAQLRKMLLRIDPGAAADEASVRIVRAPGRVNLIGEHTDYNDGYVLPAAIDLEIRICLRPVPGPEATISLAAGGESASFSVTPVGPPRGDWTDYLAGVARELDASGLKVRAFRGVLGSDLPVASGLSSSAALELAAAWALSDPEGPSVDALTVARLAQRAENEYVGVRCGLMDQFASAAGVPGAAVLLDCRTLEYRVVPLPEGLDIVIAHTGMPRTLGTSAYNERRADCERAVAIFATHQAGVTALRDVDAEMLSRYRDELDPVAARRAEHVVHENARVIDAEVALSSGDLETVGRLFAASHASLRDLYEVSSPELDTMVEIAVTTPGVIASRMTGAGFGGCTVSLVRPDAVERLTARIEREYPLRTGRTPRVWRARAVAGAGLLPD